MIGGKTLINVITYKDYMDDYDYDFVKFSKEIEELDELIYDGGYDVRGLRLEGDFLLVDVYYMGCWEDSFVFRTNGGFLESNPVQKKIRLYHHGGDNCESKFSKTLRFDLRNVKAEYLDSYGNGRMVLGCTVLMVRFIKLFTRLAQMLML